LSHINQPINIMNFRTVVLSCTALFMGITGSSVSAKTEATGNKTGFHFEAGLSYASGTENVLSQVETNFGFSRDHKWPVGIQLSAYNRFANGFAVGASAGPAMFFRVKDSGSHYENSGQWNYIIPVSADVRFFFDKRGWLAPYVRVGVVCPISGGDQIGSGSAGLIGAIGANIWEVRPMALGLEIGYDSSKVEIKSGYLHQAEKVRPTEFTFRAFVAF
jgi:hypothetical protein